MNAFNRSNSPTTVLASDEDFALASDDEEIEDVPDVPDTLVVSSAFSLQDRFMNDYFLRIFEHGLILQPQFPGDEFWDPSLRKSSVGFCCQFCAMAAADTITPGAFIFPRDFSNEELVDRIEEEFKVHCKNCPNAPTWLVRALNFIENGDTPNNAWRGALEDAGIIAVDHIEEVEDDEYVAFKSLVFNPKVHGYIFDD